MSLCNAIILKCVTPGNDLPNTYSCSRVRGHKGQHEAWYIVNEEFLNGIPDGCDPFRLSPSNFIVSFHNNMTPISFYPSSSVFLQKYSVMFTL